MHHVGRARFAGQICGNRAGVEVHLVLLRAEVVQRQRNGAVVYLQHSIHITPVEPFAHDVERNVGAVLVIAHQMLHNHALSRRIEVFDCLPRTSNRHRTRVGTVWPRHIRQMSDLEDPSRLRRADHPGRCQRCAPSGSPHQEFPSRLTCWACHLTVLPERLFRAASTCRRSCANSCSSTAEAAAAAFAGVPRRIGPGRCGSESDHAASGRSHRA